MISFGGTPNSDLEELFASNLDEIVHALETSDFVELSHDLLISHG